MDLTSCPVTKWRKRKEVTKDISAQLLTPIQKERKFGRVTRKTYSRGLSFESTLEFRKTELREQVTGRESYKRTKLQEDRAT